MTTEFKILCGIPGVGKSTWAAYAANFLEDDGYTTAIISRDKIRFAKLDEKPTDDYFAYETEVFDEFIDEINRCFEAGIDYVFADATHISPASRTKLLRRLKLDKNTKITFEVFDFDLATAIERNNKREGRECVPHKIVKSMWKNFRAPNRAEIINLENQLGLENSFSIHLHQKKEW